MLSTPMAYVYCTHPHQGDHSMKCVENNCWEMHAPESTTEWGVSRGAAENNSACWLHTALGQGV